MSPANSWRGILTASLGINYEFLSGLDVNVENIALKMKVAGTNTIIFKFKTTFLATNVQ